MYKGDSISFSKRRPSCCGIGWRQTSKSSRRLIIGGAHFKGRPPRVWSVLCGVKWPALRRRRTFQIILVATPPQDSIHFFSRTPEERITRVSQSPLKRGSKWIWSSELHGEVWNIYSLQNCFTKRMAATLLCSGIPSAQMPHHFNTSNVSIRGGFLLFLTCW